MNDSQIAALKHEANEQKLAAPFLQDLQNVQLSTLTVKGFKRLMNLSFGYHGGRAHIKAMYTQYIGETDWAPKGFEG